MLVGVDERCARCGTLLRAGRTVCPSCGLDQNSAEAQPQMASAPAAAPVMDSKPAMPKKSICPACMSSVPSDTLVEYEGSKICPECLDRMKGKMARKG